MFEGHLNANMLWLSQKRHRSMTIFKNWFIQGGGHAGVSAKRSAIQHGEHQFKFL